MGHAQRKASTSRSLGGASLRGGAASRRMHVPLLRHGSSAHVRTTTRSAAFSTLYTSGLRLHVYTQARTLYMHVCPHSSCIHISPCMHVCSHLHACMCARTFHRTHPHPLSALYVVAHSLCIYSLHTLYAFIRCTLFMQTFTPTCSAWPHS